MYKQMMEQMTIIVKGWKRVKTVVDTEFSLQMKCMVILRT